MALCGCKLSKNAPFCDKTTCLQLADGTFEPTAEDLFVVQEDVEVDFETVETSQKESEQQQKL